MRTPKIRTDLGGHIEAIYSYHGYLDRFVEVRGPVQDESLITDPDDAETARIIEAGKHRT